MTTKFYMVIKLGVRKILQGRSRMLTRDLFAVVSLLVSNDFSRLHVLAYNFFLTIQ